VRRVTLLLAIAAVVIAATAIAVHDRAFELRRAAAARRVLNDGVLRAVVLGDSVARGAGDERGEGIPGALDAEFRGRAFRTAAVANLGINGARTRDILRLLTRSTARAAIRTADVVVLSIGGNDLYGDPRARVFAALLPELQQERTAKRVQRIVGTLLEINPAARIYVLGLYNPYRRSANGAWLDRQVHHWDARLITHFAANREVRVTRICDLLERDDRISALDRFHPGGEGYTAIAARIVSSM